MAFVTRFETPGRLRDMPEASPFYDDWHRRISELLHGAAGSAIAESFDTPAPDSGFYTASVTDVRVVATRPLVWMEFPLITRLRCPECGG